MSTDFGAPNPENSYHARSEKKLSMASVEIALVLYEFPLARAYREKCVLMVCSRASKVFTGMPCTCVVGGG